MADLYAYRLCMATKQHYHTWIGCVIATHPNISGRNNPVREGKKAFIGKTHLI